MLIPFCSANVRLIIPIFAVLFHAALIHQDAAAAPSPLQIGRYQSSHFVLVSPPYDNVGTLLDELEAAWKDVRSWGLTLPARIEVRLYASTSEFVQACGGRRDHLGVAVGQRIHLQPPSVLARHGGPSHVLRHELVHVALYRQERMGLPRWYNEGLAITLAGEITDRKAGQAPRDIKELERRFHYPGNAAALRGAYATAQRLVGRVIEKHGRTAAIGLARETTSRSDFERRFRALVGMDADAWAR